MFLLFTRRANVCQCVCRKTFMTYEYPEAKHVILDEVQCFRDENGDWLGKARMLVRQHANNPEPDSGFASEFEPGSPAEMEPGSVMQWGSEESESESEMECRSKSVAELGPGLRSPCPDHATDVKDSPGFLWIFIDHDQINHLYPTGIPSVNEQNPSFRLRKVVRNSKRIFDHAKRFLSENVASQIEVGHDFEGEEVVHIKYQRDRQLASLNDVLQTLFQTGYSKGEIAVLYGKEVRIPDRLSLLSELKLENVVDAEDDHCEDVVVSTFRKYSGLDRPVVILMDIHASVVASYKCQPNASKYCAATRAMAKLVVMEAKKPETRERKLP